MQRLIDTWKKVRGPLLVVLLIAGVARTAASSGSSPPGEKEVAGARRTARSNDQGGDSRTSLPPTGYLGAPGVIEPRSAEAKIAPEVPGVVSEVLAAEGSVVEVGAPLVKMRSEVEQAALAAAEAELASAQAQLRKLVKGARAEDVEAATTDAAAARARAALSAQQLARLENLQRAGASTKEELERAATQAEADRYSAASLEARRLALANGTRREDVDAAVAAVAVSRARAAQARAAFDRLTLKAPFAGEVLQVFVRPGEYLNPAAGAAVTLGDTAALRARLDVDERDVGRVRLGQRGFVQAEALGDRRIAARVVEIGRRMGRKNVRTDEPTSRVDMQILEVVLELDQREPLPQGLRVSGYLDASPAASATPVTVVSQERGR